MAGQFGAVTQEDRLNALQGIRALESLFLVPKDLDRLAEEEREGSVKAFDGVRGVRRVDPLDVRSRRHLLTSGRT